MGWKILAFDCIDIVLGRTLAVVLDELIGLKLDLKIVHYLN